MCDSETTSPSGTTSAKTTARISHRAHQFFTQRTVVISGDGRTTCKQTRKRTTRPPLHHMVTRRFLGFRRGIPCVRGEALSAMHGPAIPPAMVDQISETIAFRVQRKPVRERQIAFRANPALPQIVAWIQSKQSLSPLKASWPSASSASGCGDRKYGTSQLEAPIASGSKARRRRGIVLMHCAALVPAPKPSVGKDSGQESQMRGWISVG